MFVKWMCWKRYLKKTQMSIEIISEKRQAQIEAAKTAPIVVGDQVFVLEEKLKDISYDGKSKKNFLQGKEGRKKR